MTKTVLPVVNNRYPAWLPVFERNGLGSFDTIWSIAEPHVIAVNLGRGGFSKVSYLDLVAGDENSVGIYIKRQRNYLGRQMRRPWRRISLVGRERENIERFLQLGLWTVEPIYFEQRRRDSNTDAILITLALKEYTSLEDLLARWNKHPQPRCEEVVMSSVMSYIIRMHNHRMMHNCLYPKHIFIRGAQPGSIDVRLIDLEKAKPVLSRRKAIQRDLGTLIRRSPNWRVEQKNRFLRAYFSIVDDAISAKKMCELLETTTADGIVTQASKCNTKR